VNNGKICVSVCAETADEMIAKIARAEEFGDVIEVRFDCLNESELGQLIGRLPTIQISKPLLATLRPSKQADLTPAKRTYNSEIERELHILESGKRFRRWLEILDIPSVVYVDFEYDLHARLWWCMSFVNFAGIKYEAKSERELARKLKDRHLILSEHYFLREEIDLDETYRRLSLEETGDDLESDSDVEEFTYIDAGISKIATRSDDILDSIAVWKLLAKAKDDGRNIIPIAMGEAGKWTRILGLAHGAYMTYAALDAGGETAPGQITAKDMVEVYRVKDLDRDTKVYGVIGDPVSQSLSPYMHNPAFVAAGVNAVFVPLLVKDLDEFVRRMVKPETREVELNFGGFSVTMPHKQAIIKHLDHLDPVAEKIGAVNTIRIDEDGKLTGCNTDAYGFITPLKQRFGDLKNARVAVFGAGGAARACVYALQQEHANVSIFGRDAQKTQRFAEECGIDWSEISNFKSQISNGSSESFDIVVDATPLGMKGALEDETLFTTDELKGVKFVYDLVTKQTDTPLICEAKMAGVPAIGGLEMLIAQGAKQFEIWTGRTASVDVLRASVLARMH